MFPRTCRPRPSPNSASSRLLRATQRRLRGRGTRPLFVLWRFRVAGDKQAPRKVWLWMDSIKEEGLHTGLRQPALVFFSLLLGEVRPPSSAVHRRRCRSCISQGDNGLFLCSDVQACAPPLRASALCSVLSNPSRSAVIWPPFPRHYVLAPFVVIATGWASSAAGADRHPKPPRLHVRPSASGSSLLGFTQQHV